MFNLKLPILHLVLNTEILLCFKSISEMGLLNRLLYFTTNKRDAQWSPSPVYPPATTCFIEKYWLFFLGHDYSPCLKGKDIISLRIHLSEGPKCWSPALCLDWIRLNFHLDPNFKGHKVQKHDLICVKRVNPSQLRCWFSVDLSPSH